MAKTKFCKAKTGTGPVILTCSFPYVRDWLNEYRFRNESNVRLICNPSDFWTSFSPKDNSEWKQIGSTRDLPEGQKTLTNTEPTVLVWQWHVPRQIGKRDEKIGILVVIESPEYLIPQKNKILNVGELTKVERHIGLKTITLVD